MAYYIFTDVHGCIDELVDLYELAGPTESDTVIVAGDLVDRGPDSPAVVKFFREKSSILICGNHEYKHGRFRKNLELQPRVARDMLRHNSELQSITDALSDDDIRYLETAKIVYQIPDTDAVVLHGGVTPTMRRLPKGDSGWSKFDAQVMYVRHLDSDGNMVRLADHKPGLRFWADVYDGRFGHIFFGHEPFLTEELPKQFEHATGLDLGCVFGGRLACVRYDEGKTDFFTVKAKRAYAKHRISTEDM